MESPRSKIEAARLKIELYKAAFPQGALSKGSTIREPYSYGGKLSPAPDDFSCWLMWITGTQFFELQQYLESLAHTDDIELRTSAIRERVELFKAAFPNGIYQKKERSRSMLG